MATDQEIIDYYADLLIIQYKGLPRAYATVQAYVEGVIINQLPTQVRDAFDPDTSIGVQLDTIGEYAGVARTGSTSEGVPISLSDSDYRQLISMAIIKHTGGSSLFDIQTLLQQFFPGEILVFDNANMHINYFVDDNIGTLELVQMFVLQDLLPKPMGVRLASLIYLPTIDDLYGFRTYIAAAPANVSPMNSYASYILTRPWLSYADTITF